MDDTGTDFGDREVQREHGLAEQGPSAEEEVFFRQAQWRLAEEAPKAIEFAGKQIMVVAAILSGGYFAALTLSGMAMLDDPLGLLLFIPYLLWVPAFFCGWLAGTPDPMVIWQDGAPATREALQRLAALKCLWLKRAHWLTFISLVAMLLIPVAVLLLTTGGFG